MEFPCSIHKDHYDNCRIVVSEEELKIYRADGWKTSADWYAEVLGVGTNPVIIEDEASSIPRRGRPRKVDE